MVQSGVGGERVLVALFVGATPVFDAGDLVALDARREKRGRGALRWTVLGRDCYMSEAITESMNAIL